MRKILRFIFGVIFFLSAVGVYLTNRIMFIKKKDEELILNRERDAGWLDLGEFFQFRDVSIPSPFGYEIKAQLYEPHTSKRYVIIAHGVTENKINSMKYMNLFLKRGFNAVIYDHRRHGESGGETTSYGHYEKFDLQAVVHWLKKEIGPDLLLGIHGESMGAVTLLLYAGMLEDGADFYIADCPFSDFKEQLAHVVKEEVKLPAKWFLPLADVFLKMRDRYSLGDISPISVIDNIQNPILFIHSKEDAYILPEMTEQLFERKKGPKMIFLATNGGHAHSLRENKEDYEKALDEFLGAYVYLKDNKLFI